MAKEKLFKPEDFDKPKDKGLWQKYKGLWQKYKARIIGLIVPLIVVGVVICCISYYKEKEIVEQVQIEQNIQDSATSAISDETEAIKTPDKQEFVETEALDVVPSPTQGAEPPKTEAEHEELIPSAQPTNISDNIEQEALNVIRGEYGVFPERREILGSKYQEIQNRVNKLKKQGVF